MASSLFREMARLRLQTLARALADDDGVTVRFGPLAAADVSAKEIILRSPEEDVVPGVPSARAERWLAVRAACAHEAAHLLYTDGEAWKEAVRRGPLFRDVVNVLEDARVERAAANAFPGVAEWFRFANWYVYRHRRDWGRGARAFVMGLCCYAVVGAVPDGLEPGLRELVERCRPYVDAARLERDTRGVLEWAERICAEVEGAFPPPAEAIFPAPRFAVRPRPAPEGPADPRVMRAVPVRVAAKECGPESEGSALFDDDAEFGGSGCSAEGGAGGREGPEADVGDGVESGIEPEAEAGLEAGEEFEAEAEGEIEDGFRASFEDGEESPGASENVPGFGTGASEICEGAEKELGAEPEGASGGKTRAESGQAEPEAESGEEPWDGPGGGAGYEARSGSDGGPSDDWELGQEESSGAERIGAASEPLSEPLNETFVESEGEGVPDEPEDAGEEEAGAGFEEEICSLEWEDEAGVEEDDEEGGTEEDSGSAFRLSVLSGDFEDGPAGENFEALLESAEEELAALEAGAERREKEEARAEASRPATDWSRVEAEVSVGLHRGCRLEVCEIQPSPKDYLGIASACAGVARRLAEEIARALAYRPTVDRRGLHWGRLDPSALWKMRVGDPAVFRRRELPGSVPAAAVLLLVDCSGSMWGQVPACRKKTKMDLAVQAAVVLHEACVALGVPHCVYGFNSAYPLTWFYRAVGWDERDGSRLASLRPDYSNRDGYALRAAGRELMLRPEPRKVLIALSDGLPSDDGDRGYRPDTQGPPDTARAVRELERRGISVVGLYFGPEEGLKQARAMYNRLVYAPFPEHLPVLLGRVLREVLAPAV